MRAQFVLSEVGSGLRRNVTMTVAAILNITISLTLLGGALMIRNGADRLQHDVLNQLEVSVLPQPGVRYAERPDRLPHPGRADLGSSRPSTQLPQVELGHLHLGRVAPMQRFQDDSPTSRTC